MQYRLIMDLLNLLSLCHILNLLFYDMDRGGKAQVEVGGLGPEECYLFRIGITRPNEQSPLLWSKTVPANTKGLCYWFCKILEYATSLRRVV